MRFLPSVQLDGEKAPGRRQKMVWTPKLQPFTSHQCDATNRTRSLSKGNNPKWSGKSVRGFSSERVSSLAMAFGYTDNSSIARLTCLHPRVGEDRQWHEVDDLARRDANQPKELLHVRPKALHSLLPPLTDCSGTI